MHSGPIDRDIAKIDPYLSNEIILTQCSLGSQSCPLHESPVRYLTAVGTSMYSLSPRLNTLTYRQHQAGKLPVLYHEATGKDPNVAPLLDIHIGSFTCSIANIVPNSKAKTLPTACKHIT